MLEQNRGHSPGQRNNRPRGSALATTLGVIAAFFLTPILQHASAGPVEDFTFDQYGPALVFLVGPILWVGCAALAFFATRALTPRLLRLFEFYVWRRIFP